MQKECIYGHYNSVVHQDIVILYHDEFSDLFS
jgi:hypothetical protein